MSDAGTDAGTVWTGARLRDAPRKIFYAFVLVEFTAAVLLVVALLAAQPTSAIFTRFSALVVLCVVFEEISLQAGKMRLLISAGPQSDMTSVWTFAATLVLPAGFAAIFALVSFGDLWLRKYRTSGRPAYREVYTAAVVALSCLGTTAVRANVENQLTGLPDALVTAVAIVFAAVAFTAINRGLIFFAARLIYPDAKLPVIGSWEDNALELATLCLGAMTGVVLLHQPWVSVLVLLPMVLLQRGALVKELEQAASTDAKTGLLNATVWQEAARRELARVDREEVGAAVLILDLDHFKSVNDDHGHLFGDAALLAVSTRLKAELRQYDVVGRFGGEEFVVMLPRVTAAEASAAAERLRAAIGSIAYDDFAGTLIDADSPARTRTLSVSIGVALFPDHGAELEELLHKADAALYVAKRTGRNRVTVAANLNN